MTKKDRFNLYDDVTNKIVKKMEQGVDSWQKTWSSDLPRNIFSKRDYSGVNTLLLWLEQQERGYASGDWLTYRQAALMDATVRKGEKGSRIVFFKRLEREVEADSGEMEIRQSLMAKYSTVFNVSQVDGLTAQKIQAAQQEHQSAAELIAVSGAKIVGGQPSFSPKLDVIRLPEQSSFKSLDDYYATALHELSHWSGHESRLDRDLSGRFGDASYAMEELVAELSSAFLSAKCGIQGKLQHAEYLNSWVKVLKFDNRTIFNTASKARQASEYLQSEICLLNNKEYQH